MKVPHALLETGIVYPPKQPAVTQSDPLEVHVEERWPINIEPGKEYDLLQHLSKISTKISIFELINSSLEHQKQLFDSMKKIQIPFDTTPKKLAETLPTIVNYGGAFPINFTGQEIERVSIPAKMAPLNVTVTVVGYRVQGALVYIGASLNICPIHTFHMMASSTHDCLGVC